MKREREIRVGSLFYLLLSLCVTLPFEYVMKAHRSRRHMQQHRSPPASVILARIFHVSDLYNQTTGYSTCCSNYLESLSVVHHN